MLILYSAQIMPFHSPSSPLHHPTGPGRTGIHLHQRNLVSANRLPGQNALVPPWGHAMDQVSRREDEKKEDRRGKKEILHCPKYVCMTARVSITFIVPVIFSLFLPLFPCFFLFSKHNFSMTLLLVNFRYYHLFLAKNSTAAAGNLFVEAQELETALTAIFTALNHDPVEFPANVDASKVLGSAVDPLPMLVPAASTPSANEVPYFFHVPKAAGTSIERILSTKRKMKTLPSGDLEDLRYWQFLSISYLLCYLSFIPFIHPLLHSLSYLFILLFLKQKVCGAVAGPQAQHHCLRENPLVQCGLRLFRPCARLSQSVHRSARAHRPHCVPVLVQERLDLGEVVRPQVPQPIDGALPEGRRKRLAHLYLSFGRGAARRAGRFRPFLGSGC